ncbi:MAG: cation transporter, partial [Chloroflexota bacterium]
MTNTQEAESSLNTTSFRYRVFGMDCAKDAAQIERAAQSAGVSPNAVKVSSATHIMTLLTLEAHLPEIERAIATTGYGFERIEAEEVSFRPAYKDPFYRRALWIVVGLNLGYGIVEMLGGFMSASQALKADALDFMGDGTITFIGLLAIGWSLTWRARSAMTQGVFLGVLGLSVIGSTIWRIV